MGHFCCGGGGRELCHKIDDFQTRGVLPRVFLLSVDAFELPGVWGEVGEAEEGVVVELDVPLGVLPAVGGVPPVTGEGEGAEGVDDGALMGAVEEGEGVVMAAAGFGGDVDGDGRAVAA